MRVKNIGALLMMLIVVVAVTACRRDEHSVTGSYGSSIVTGQVTMASSIANGSPAGVQVTVAGTGMTTILGADGRFAFSGVPEDAKLHFTRADGIDAVMALNHSGTVSVELAANTASTSGGGRRRAVGSAPQLEIEGPIKTASATSLVVTAARTKQDVTVALTSTTVIRKGDVTVAAADLKAGDQVHVRATVVNNTATATLVIVQQPETEKGDDNGANVVTANGIVASVAADAMVVHRANGSDVNVKVGSTTDIKKHGVAIPFSSIKAGDHVEVRGTKVDDKTVQAVQIEVEDAPGTVPDDHNNGAAEVSGSVTAVTAASLTVGGTTVKVDSHTVIRKNGQTISLGGVKVGDRVEAKGTRVDATTILASTIEVSGSESGGGHH
jgi:hypothetical protein